MSDQWVDIKDTPVCSTLWTVICDNRIVKLYFDILFEFFNLNLFFLLIFFLVF